MQLYLGKHLILGTCYLRRAKFSSTINCGEDRHVRTYANYIHVIKALVLLLQSDTGHTKIHDSAKGSHTAVCFLSRKQSASKLS
jgi:hypothetical protein